MKKEKAWVWFKGGLNGGEWIGGFSASTSEDQEGVLIENIDFKTCRVPLWRITLTKPINDKEPPEIPDNAIWKYN